MSDRLLCMKGRMGISAVKRTYLAGAAVLLSLSGIMYQGCRITQKAAPTPDRYEILIRHLLEESEQRDREMHNQMAQCTRELLHTMEPLSDRAANLKRYIEDLEAEKKFVTDSIERSTQLNLDYEDFTAEHNRRYPKTPWAVGGPFKENLEQSCKPCTKERARRDEQLKAEATAAQKQ
jgi:hypothetical protein